MFLHTFNPKPILVSLGGLEIHWYGFFLAIGALAGFFVITWLVRQYRLDDHHPSNLFFLLIIFGFIGARLWHVSNEWSYYSLHADDIVKIWNGGLGIHGGLIAGILVVIVYCAVKKLNFWLVADILAPGLILAQAIGRWGNYFNQELFGHPTEWAFGIPISPANRPAGFEQFEFFHPTFLYESVGSLIIFIILISWHIHRLRLKRDENIMARFDLEGAIVLGYFAFYSIVRIVLETVRIDRTPIIGGIRLPIITSSVIILGAIIAWFILRARLKKSYLASQT